jgi:hypothetical protein
VPLRGFGPAWICGGGLLSHETTCINEEGDLETFTASCESCSGLALYVRIGRDRVNCVCQRGSESVGEKEREVHLIGSTVRLPLGSAATSATEESERGNRQLPVEASWSVRQPVVDWPKVYHFGLQQGPSSKEYVCSGYPRPKKSPVHGSLGVAAIDPHLTG